MRVLVALISTFLVTAVPLEAASAQFSRVFSRRGAACRCEPPGRTKRPRFLIPMAGGIGVLPVSIAARDSQLPTLEYPTLVDIRDVYTPQNAIEGARALAVGALAPNTATALPTFMAAASVLALTGIYLASPRRRRRRVRSRDSTAPRGRWRLRTVYRRRLGLAVAACGGVGLLLGSREYAEGAQAQRRARAQWFAPDVAQPGHDVAVTQPGQPATANRLTTSRDPARASSAIPFLDLVSSGPQMARGTPVARLMISDIKLDEIVVEGVGPVELNGGPGHFPGSALPGESGNAIISAHRDRHFRRLDEVTLGTRLRTETRAGATEWVVVERRIVGRDTPALFQESEATLTLTTCWPLRYFGPAPDRLLIIAKPAS